MVPPICSALPGPALPMVSRAIGARSRIAASPVMPEAALVEPRGQGACDQTAQSIGGPAGCKGNQVCHRAIG